MTQKLYVIAILALIAFISCEAKIENKLDNEGESVATVLSDDTLAVSETPILEDTVLLALDDTLRQYYERIGLQNIAEIIPQVRVDLKYSGTDNFVGIDMYGSLNAAYCQPDMAKKLQKAYDFLQEIDSNLTLLVFDAVRPVSVQQKMWDTLKLPIREKTKFLSNPRNHSIHNYGAAVDISISTKNGEELDMGTPFDFIGKLAHPREEQRLLKEGKLTQKHIENRELLRKVMKKSGFFNIQTEWWHWNSCNRTTAKKLYKVVR